MEAAMIVAGALLCWRAPMPDLMNRTELPVQVLELKLLPTGDPGAWVQTTTGRLAGQQWHVAQSELKGCKPLPAARK